MNCEPAREYLLDHLDNELPATLQQELSEHLRACASCREELEEYRKTALLLQLRAVPEPPEEYWEQTWARIRARTVARVLPLNPARIFRRPAWQASNPRGWPARLAIAALLLIALASVLMTLPTPPQRLGEPRTRPRASYAAQRTLNPEDMSPEMQRQIELLTFTAAAAGALDPISKGATKIILARQD
jgi:anti-sigma factor RsiW